MGNIFSCSCGADALLSPCFGCTVRKGSYITELQDNLDVLQMKLQELTAESKDVMTRATLAKAQGYSLKTSVEDWLSRVANIRVEVAELQAVKSQEIEKSCFGDYDSKSSYKFRKRIIQTLEEMTNLKAAGVFHEVHEEFPEDSRDEIPMDPNIVGQQPMFNEVWSCLNQEQVGIVGLYGVAGVGKTTLLRQIHNRLLNEGHLFDVVIWTVVSIAHSLESVQKDIGRKIGTVGDSWSRKNLEEKAVDIFKILKHKRFVLLLDDIWKPVDLMKLGVPLSKTSKVIFTTRSSYVCRAMRADREFEVMRLKHMEAWNLFENKVGIDVLNSHPEIPKLAEIIVKECDRLPLALITLARSMAGKREIEEWRRVVEVLSKSRSGFSGMENYVYSSLKSTYDRLPNQEIRSCFLYCCLFPEDYRIDKMYLIECWLVEGFLGEYDGNTSMNRGYSIIGDLVRACLLEEGDDYVNMHDVIRDFALWLTDKEKENLVVPTDGVINSASEIEKWEGVKRISLMKNKIKNLLDSPRCPNLQTLFLGNNNLRTIGSEFFQYMPSLRILNLSHNWNLEKLPFGISNLVSLEHLDLSHTRLYELPQEMKKLAKLKFFSVYYTPFLCTIPREILSNLLMLRTLLMEESGFVDHFLFNDWEPLMEELLGLEHLNTLSLTLQNAQDLQNFASSHIVQNCVGLFLVNVKDSNALHSLCIRSCGFESLEIDGSGFKSLDIGGSGFKSLNRVRIQHCHELKDVTWLILAPNLKNIHITFCWKMKEIINIGKLVQIQEMLGNGRQIIPFERLKSLELESLLELKSIYSSALPFECLMEITVYGCPELKELPLDSKSSREREVVIKGGNRWWKNLQWKDEATKKKFDSSFRFG